MTIRCSSRPPSASLLVLAKLGWYALEDVVPTPSLTKFRAAPSLSLKGADMGVQYPRADKVYRGAGDALHPSDDVASERRILGGAVAG